jgi:hypothetical protein
MNKQINKKALFKEWIHSKEEDTEDEAIFRPADYNFPLSRQPRESFKLVSDGSMINSEISPDDSLEEKQGTWKLVKNEIAFYNNSKQFQKKVISSLEPNKLVLKK